MCACSARSAWCRCVEEVDVAAVTAVAVKHGVWLRPFRDLIYTMPPYVIVEDDLARVTGAMVAAAQ